MSSSLSLIAGIDLGTTNSLIGVMEAGFPILLADAAGERLTPSVVYFPKEAEGGEPVEPSAPIVGRAAARMRTAEPASTVYSVKRFMGRRTGEEEPVAGYRLAGEPGGPVQIVAGGRTVSPEEVSACILRELKRQAERALEQEVSRAVITVPAYFNDAQRQATKRAGELAGFTVERIVNEPTAAALSYGLDRLREKSRIAVYDLGGGTFDISLLELNQGVFEVLATNGNTRLGGDDLDRALVAWLAERAGVSAEAPRLSEIALQAKHRLSEEESVELVLPFIEGARSTTITLTRAELEVLARPIVERTRQHCLRVLADARLQPADLDDVILVGGQTRMPLVRTLVAEIFGRAPNTSQDPDEAVARGATIQAGILMGTVQNMVLLDITPLSLGIETFGGLMNVIIPRNTSIPCKAGELFTNAIGGQQSMLIKVLQGEREMARDNWELGHFTLPFEQAPKGQARVGVQFEIDANGILHVLARDTKTNREHVVEIASAVDVSDEAVEKMLEDSLEHAFEDVNERIFTEAKMKADELLPAVRKAMEQVGAQLDADERAKIDECVAAVEKALAAGLAPGLKQANAALDDATQRLATLLIERAMAGR
ncbi:MAG TPA: Hsp70 family protein [Chthoniobacteraceae bacterium]|nr:Hsp70 family protein [Chthoniobacteraceae bacterium]